MKLQQSDGSRILIGLIAVAMVGATTTVGASVPNDDWEQAEPITGEGIFAFDNLTATTDGPSESCPFPTEITHDVWFCWTPTYGGTVTVDTCAGTTVDTILAVYESCYSGPYWFVECNDDDCVYQSRMSFDAYAYYPYLIRIGVPASLGGGSGLFTITYGEVAEPSCTLPDTSCQNRELWDAYNSNRSDYLVADDFTPQSNGLITELCWWGTYFDGLEDCFHGSLDTFEVWYYVDDGGLPGPLLAGPFSQIGGTLSVAGPARTDGLLLDGLREYEYSATHGPVPVLAGECYWLEISNAVSDSCAWFWEAAAPGNRWALQAGDGVNPPEYDPNLAITDDLAFCFDILREDFAPCAPPPVNDECTNSLLIFDGETSFDTTGATCEGPDEPACQFTLGDPEINQDIWFDYVAPCSGTVTVTMCDSLYDTKMSVYEGGECPPVDDPIACDDDACGGDFPWKSLLLFPVDSGQTYKLRIGGYADSVGPGSLVLSLNRPDCNGSGVGDDCDIMEGTSDDCNDNGVPDECDVTGVVFTAVSEELSPVDTESPQSFMMPLPPEAPVEVTFSFTAIADLGDPAEYVNVYLNGTLLDLIFWEDANNCPATPDTDEFTILASEFNSLVDGGNAVIDLLPWEAVSGDECPDGFISVTVQYAGEATSLDCNGNAIPDECELGDFDGDGHIALTDFAEWEACMTGPVYSPLTGCCSQFDFDGDQDVDHQDFAAFQTAFTGS